jgi:tetratricopeptide (TPR) repeat protein
MAEHFISREDAESDLLFCAAYIAERIASIEGHADAMAAVVPQYIANGNVDLAAELANTVDDPYTRDRLLTAVAEKCAEKDDDEYALQLAEAVEDAGLRSQALERVGLQFASKGKFESAHSIADSMAHPDGVLVGIAVKQAVDGLDTEATKTIEEIEHAGAAVSAYFEIALHWFRAENAGKAVEYLEHARDEAENIEHTEEKARAFCDLGNAFIEVGRNDRAIETFDKAKATAETIDNIHRDTFLSLAAQGFLHAGSLDLADRTLDLVTDKTAIASCLLGYSREFWRKDDRAEAIESLEEAHAMLESQHERETRDHKARFRLFTSIAAQFAGFEKGERAIEIAERIQDEGERTSALKQIAGILTFRKEDDEARHAFRAINDDGDRAFALIGMSDAKEKNEDGASAIDILNEANVLAESVPQLTFRASAYKEIGVRLHKFGESSSAAAVFGNALDAIAQLRDESAKAVALAGLAQIFHENQIEPPISVRERILPIVQRAISG